MNQTPLLTQLSVSENVLAQELNGEVVLLDMDTETYYSLNSVGSRVWQLLARSEDIAAVMQQLLRVYQVDEAALYQDVAALVEELVQEGLLIESES